jgi:beta-aspartyl-peptidase (threonine type)
MMSRVVVHAGVDTPMDDAVTEALREAADASLTELAAGASAVASAVAAVTVLEDAPVLNAGTGSVLNADGVAEADAGVVDGSAHRFAGVAALSGIRNPVQAASALLGSSAGPVLLVGEGARRFALAAGLGEADLATHEQREIWRNVMTGEGAAGRSAFTGRPVPFTETVGAIVATGGADGALAAAASTGGVLLKLPGRVGDSAIHGAGIYADEDVAFLCSGQGEATIELNLAVRVAARDGGRTMTDAVRWGVETGQRLKGMCGGIVGYDRRSDTVAVATNAASFPVMTATASSDPTVVPPAVLDGTR